MNLNAPRPLLKKTALFVVFVLFFLSFLSIKLWDYDFWFHIATGRYIVEKREIPSQDTFNFVTEENRGRFSGTILREKFLMRAYWLSQVIFFYIFSWFGSWGMVVLRSLLLTITLMLVYTGLRRSGVTELFSLSLLIPIFSVLLTKYTGERPLLFTFVIALLVFLLIEDFLRSQGKGIYFLPFIMMLWSNLHGGYILGIVFILIYITIESSRYMLRKSVLQQNKFYLFISLLLVSVVFSSLNPNGLTVFSMFDQKYNAFYANIQEYQPLFEFYRKKVVNMNFAVLFIVVITAVTLLLRSLKMRPDHLLLLVGMFVESLLHQRYFVFSATIGMVIVGGELAGFYRNLSWKRVFFQKNIVRKAGTFAMIFSLLFFTGKTALAVRENLRNISSIHSIESGKGAVDFIEKSNLKGRMFNMDAIGGYAIWRLYPGRQVFADTRLLDIASLIEFSNIISANSADVGGQPLWERLLGTYKVDFMVVNPFDQYGNLVPLIEAVIENERWVMVFADRSYFIFVRNSENNQTVIDSYSIAKNDAYWHIIKLASANAMDHAANPAYFKSIGVSFMRLKDYGEADKAFRHVLRLDPGNREALNALSEMHEMKSTGK